MKILPKTKIYCTNTSSRFLLSKVSYPYTFHIEDGYCLIRDRINLTLSLNLSYGDINTVIRKRND